MELTGPDAVADRHIVFWLHQPEAVPAEVKLGMSTAPGRISSEGRNHVSTRNTNWEERQRSEVAEEGKRGRLSKFV